jgi:hypothetical protein
LRAADREPLGTQSVLTPVIELDALVSHGERESWPPLAVATPSQTSITHLSHGIGTSSKIGYCREQKFLV